MGDSKYRKAIAAGEFTVVGPKALTPDIPTWAGNSIFADIRSVSEI